MKKNIINLNTVQETIWNNTNQALKLMIENCYLSQVGIKGHPNINHNNYAKEFCTVRFASSRRSGHSTAIAKIALEYFNKALILSPTLDMSRHLYQYFMSELERQNITAQKITQSKIIITEDHENMYHFGSLEQNINAFRGISLEAIIVDCAFMMSNAKEEKLYKDFIPAMSCFSEGFWIFIG